MRKVYYNNIFAHLLLLRKGFDTAMLFGFICTKHKTPLSGVAVNHEAIHNEQYMEITALAVAVVVVGSIAFGWAAWPFVLALAAYYIIYFVEAAVSWVHHFFAHRKKDAGDAADKAYYSSMFEQEAYEHESDFRYIPQRKPFGWIKYFGKV